MRICSECKQEYVGAEIFCPRDGARIIDPAQPANTSRRRSIPPTPVGDDPLIGQEVQQRYRILSRLGEGGMGVVYVAEHIEIEKKVALKVLRDDFSSKPDVVERFRQEARSASKIGNPHIVDVTDFGQLPDGGVFFVMEMLEGVALDELCNGQPVPLSRMAPIVDQIARGLQAAHDKGIVHRDLKPENVFLVNRDDQPDFVKILDFGIAKMSDRDEEGKRLTQTGMIFGTPEYMSPEQASGKSLDHRVDIYALGCMMFEMLTGRVPYTGDSFMAILTQHMFEPIPDIRELAPDTDAPDSVLNVVYRAMSKEAATRYGQMSELRSDLAAALANSDFKVAHPGLEQTISLSQNRAAAQRPTQAISGDQFHRRKNKKVLVGVTLTVLLLVGIGGGVLFGDFGSADKPVNEVKLSDPLPVKGDLPKVVENKDEKVIQTDNKVLVTLGSMPPGAVMFVEGMGQVCSNAPCQVKVVPGTPLKVRAEAGDISNQMVFTPSDQNTELIINLDIPTADEKRQPKTRRRRKVVKGGAKSKSTGVGKGSSGLKIPDLFKNN